MDEPLEALLYRALTSKLGIAVESNDPDRLRQRLYPARKSQDIFSPLSFVLSPVNPNHLWIVRKPDNEE